MMIHRIVCLSFEVANVSIENCPQILQKLKTQGMGEVGENRGF